MESVEIRVRELAKQMLKFNQTDFVILPMGKYGNITKQILEEYGLKPRYCIDNYIYDNQDIYPLSNIQWGRDTIYLLAVSSERLRWQFLPELRKYVSDDRIIDIFRFMKNVDEICPKEQRQKLDFLCVGFPKCGTTSLHDLLRSNDHIYLPKSKGKQTQFIANVSEESHKYYLWHYPCEQLKNKIIGGIEPGYCFNYENVHQYYGKDIRLIFCMRNPVNALFSWFKLRMRRVTRKEDCEYIKKYGKVSIAMFEEWYPSDFYRYLYVEYIKEYLKYYDRDQMMFILSEEMFKEPSKIMDEVQNFIGLSKENSLECTSFPWSNQGNRVAKDYHSALAINGVIQGIYANHIYDDGLQNKLFDLEENIMKYTTTEYNEKLPDYLYEKIFDEYRESISELEEIIGRSLDGIWY